jgi:hypothetical protein
MTTRPYHTLCLWDADLQKWFDQFGDYKKADVKAEADAYFTPRGHKVIITHKDDAASMLAARNALPPPRFPNAK